MFHFLCNQKYEYKKSNIKDKAVGRKFANTKITKNTKI